jgi:hypothetical protein
MSAGPTRARRRPAAATVLVAAAAPAAVALTAVALAAGLASAVRRGGTHVAGTAADTAIVSDGIAFFESRLAADPGNDLVAQRLLDRYLVRFGTGADLDDLARAERIAGRLAAARDDAEAHARLAGLALARHDVGAALDAARAALARDSASPAATGALFDAMLAAGRYDEAERALARLPAAALATRTRRAQWLDARGDADEAHRTLARVCAHLERAQVRPVGVAWCLTELGRIAHARSGVDEAEAIFAAALRRQPGYRGALEGLADLAAARGDWRRAERLYAGLVSDAHPDVWLRLAEARTALRNARGAAAARRGFRAATASPLGARLAGTGLVFQYAAASDRASLDSALAAARREVERRPTVESWDALAWAHLRRGELRAAIAASDRAVAWGSPSPTMLAHRGRILAALGRPAEAAPLLAAARRRPDLLEPHARALVAETGGT